MIGTTIWGELFTFATGAKMLSLAVKKYSSELGVYRSFIRTFAETDRCSMFEESTDMKIGTQKCIDGSPKPPHFGITPVKAHPTNMRYHFKDGDKLKCSIDDIVLPKTTIKHFNWIDNNGIT